MFDSKIRITTKILGLMVFVAMALPVWAQEQTFESGRVVRMDEYGESLTLDSPRYSESIYPEYASEKSEKEYPWIPILSPVMFCLDCYITRVFNIHDYYSQQAAANYFSYSEWCGETALCPDPCIGTGSKYLVLAPIYAMCPKMLADRCRMYGYGGSSMYGIPSPVPSVQVVPSQGTQTQISQVQDSATAQVAAAHVIDPIIQKPVVDKQNSVVTAETGSQWSRMSDEEILRHFGLDPSAATASSPDVSPSELDKPVLATGNWEYADQSHSTDLNQLVAAVTPKEEKTPIRPVNSVETVKDKPVVSEAKQVSEKHGFSVTDQEYDRMMDIQESLLDFK